MKIYFKRFLSTGLFLLKILAVWVTFIMLIYTERVNPKILFEFALACLLFSLFFLTIIFTLNIKIILSNISKNYNQEAVMNLNIVRIY